MEETLENCHRVIQLCKESKTAWLCLHHLLRRHRARPTTTRTVEAMSMRRSSLFGRPSRRGRPIALGRGSTEMAMSL